MKKHLITGITGQDGIFLTREILKDNRNTKIIGISRNKNTKNFYKNLSRLNLKNLEDVEVIDVDLNNSVKVESLLNSIKPDFVYNLAGPSSPYESIENPKKAKDLIGQVREKLGKDADAGDYIKDFRKSKAPQFKGKSDKKIQKMAIAAYLDSKEEVELDESKDVRKKYKGKEQKSVDKLIMQKGVDKVQKFHDKNPREFDNMVKKLAMLEEVELDEQKVFVFRYEYKGKRYAAPFKSEKDAKDAMKAAMTDKNVKNASMTQDILKRGVKFAEDVEIVEFIDEAVLAGRDYNYDGKSPIKISKKMYTKVQKDSKSMIKGKPYMMALNPKTQGTELVPVVFEEVDNSLAAQASTVISQTAIKEKKDPADIDFTATDLDRKAADKNIFVQLKRAQDMKGKGDVEFLDKKKKKVDIRIINKAIDMMMKMKPADRAKMQTAIGKSYRDLLKTVQRGKV